MHEHPQYNICISCSLEFKRGDHMSDRKMIDRSLNWIEMMKAGYKEMGMLNVSLSEEGLNLDVDDLESYEKNLVESE